MNHEAQENLSPQGELRREEMLAELVSSMTRLHRRRRIRRRPFSVAAVIALVIGAFRLMNFEPQPSQMVTIEPAGMPGGVTVQTPPLAIQYVKTDPSAVQRYRAKPRPIVVIIDDAQLVRTLIEIGRPAGLIRVGERVALSASVTDEELHLPK